MKILLDTHILLWWLMDDPALSARARDLIADRENTLFVSAVSLWEIRLKQSLGRIELPADFDEILAGESFEPLPLAAVHTPLLADLPWIHPDPFDRMLIAQARAMKFQFLTADSVCRDYGPEIEFAG
jgi:PIN domain nuclease of toxin-antitoxin system